MATSNIKVMAIQIAKSVYRLPTLGSFINSYAFINTDSSLTLVDCGLEGSSKKLIRDLARIGKHPKDVTNIVFTHAHDDHVGGAASMIKTCEVKNVMMHEDDSYLPSIGKTPSRDDSRLSGKIMNLLPDRGYEPFEITKRLKDGEVIDTAGGIRSNI